MPPDRNAADLHRLLVVQRLLAGDGLEQLLLAVAGDPGDAHDLAAAHLQVDVLEVDPERVVGGLGQARRCAAAPRRLRRARRAWMTGRSSPIIMRAMVLRRLLATACRCRSPCRRAGWWRVWHSSWISSSLWLM